MLILDGEELIGAKQNRVANVTILAPAGQTITIPVSCVEAGRWHATSAEFSLGDRAMFSDSRRRKTARVSESLRAAGERDADQGAVWAEIEAKAERMCTASPTQAMADIFEHHQTQIEDYADGFTALPDQVGAVFAIDERIEGLEFFDSPGTLADMLPKLVRSYAIDAMETAAQSQDRKPSAIAATRFMEQLMRAEVETYPAVGLGTDIRLTAPGVVAGGLVNDDRVVHLAAFSAPAGSGSEGMRRSSSARRQSWMRRVMGD